MTDAILYVDLTAKTSGNGSKDKPFRTMQEARDSVAKGGGTATVHCASAPSGIPGSTKWGEATQWKLGGGL